VFVCPLSVPRLKRLISLTGRIAFSEVSESVHTAPGAYI
jgi:hypothetical protein